MVRVIAWSVAIVALTVGAFVLRDLTMTTYEDPRPGSRTHVVLHVETVGNHFRPRMARALFDACATRVRSTYVAGSWRDLGDDRFEAQIEPAISRFERRELEGCLEDRTLDHVQAVVEDISPIG